MENFPVPFKYLIIGAAALLTTILCLLLMQALIATELRGTPPMDPPRISAPLEPIDQEIEHRETRTRPWRVLPAEMPPEPDGLPIPVQEPQILVKATRPSFGSIADNLDTEALDFELVPPVRDLVPLYVVQPVYPFKAVMKEIEGYVLVSFGVRQDGSVVNPVIIESDPGTLFDEAALSAVSKFRFQPRMMAGDPVSVEDLKLRFLFRLQPGDGGLVRSEILRPGETGLR